ncbi:DUF4381 domain-containing protein [Pseudomonas aeruginosa]|nr:DUF4381 domain-containing protein [Pseudomonas aeruginosa]
MNPLDRLEPLIAPLPVGWWPPAPGWWLLAALLPLLGWGLWRLRRHLPRRTIATRGEAPLDPLREAAGRTGRACQALRQGFRRALAAGHQRPAQAGLQGALAR